MRSGAVSTGRRFICNAYAATEAGRADAKLVSFNTSKWLKRRTGRLATIRAVAIQRIRELVGHFVANAAT
jgi:hypothetical protein